MVISNKLKSYLKDSKTQTLIEDGDFNSLYRDFNSKYSLLDTRDLTRLLYLAGIDPLSDQLMVPDFFLYGSISLNQELKDLFRSFHIPEGIESIGYSSFKFCKGIERLYLPSTLKFIDEEGLNMSEDLKEIHYNGMYEEWQDVTKGNRWISVFSSNLNKDKSLICKNKTIKISVQELLKNK